MEDRESGGFDHVWVAQQRLFDLGRRDLLPSAVDDVLDAPDNEEISLCVQVPQVAGSEPAVPKSGLRSGGIIVIPPRYGGAPQRDLSTFAELQPSTLALQDRDPRLRPSPSRIGVSAPADWPTEPSFRRSKGFAAIWVAASVMPYVSITGTPNMASSPQSTFGGKDEEAERMSRKEDRWALCLRPSAADKTARWIAGTAVYQVGRNSVSQPKKASGSKPGVQTTLEPAANEARTPEIKPCPWNRGSTLSNRS